MEEPCIIWNHLLPTLKVFSPSFLCIKNIVSSQEFRLPISISSNLDFFGSLNLTTCKIESLANFLMNILLVGFLWQDWKWLIIKLFLCQGLLCQQKCHMIDVFPSWAKRVSLLRAKKIYSWWLLCQKQTKINWILWQIWSSHYIVSLHIIIYCTYVCLCMLCKKKDCFEWNLFLWFYLQDITKTKPIGN